LCLVCRDGLRVRISNAKGAAMSISIDKSFVEHFQADVHQAYQRMGSKLRNTVRVKNGIKGATTVFQKVGKGIATTKARHAKGP